MNTLEELAELNRRFELHRGQVVESELLALYHYQSMLDHLIDRRGALAHEWLRHVFPSAGLCRHFSNGRHCAAAVVSDGDFYCAVHFAPNPLHLSNQRVVTAPLWGGVFRDDTIPTVVDIGCYLGEWLELLSARHKTQQNFLGLEILENVVHTANTTNADSGNLRFVCCNAATSLRTLQIPRPKLVCVQYPDPWHAGKHGERRLLRDAFAAELAAVLPAGCCLYISSDYEELAESMVSSVLRTDAFAPWPADRVLPVVNTLPPPLLDSVYSSPMASPRNDASAPATPTVTWQWCDGGNPFGVPTQRDVFCESKPAVVRRILLLRL
jgi:tRNA (guanine-N7-)-methyltransferase